MDVENLDAGQDFDELPETCTIFITEKDQFADGKPYHRIECVDMDTEGKPLWDDGEHIPQALIVADGKFACDTIEDRIIELKGLLDFI